MQRVSGARVVASAADAHLLATGGTDDFSPLPKELVSYPPVKADRIIQDGQQVELGGIALTANLTPGHTRGATTWTMTVSEGGKTYHVVFFSSLGLVEPTRLLNNAVYPGIADDYAASFKKLKALPCDIYLAPHADQFDLHRKLSRLEQSEAPNPFVDLEGWQS